MLKKFILSFLICFLSFASFYSGSTDYEYSVFSTDENKILNPDLLNNEELIGQIAKDFFATKEKNNEVFGWINIPGVAYYPVMYTGDQKYLRKDLNGNFSWAGTLFMDKKSEGSFEDMAMIYGHHMSNGTMFAGLRKYEYQDFFQQNECIQVFDGKNLYYYKPYTTLYVKDGQEFIKKEFESEEIRTEYFKSLYDRSIVKMEEGLYPDFTEQMLYLQTCEYYFQDCRLIVGCYLVKTVPYEK